MRETDIFTESLFTMCRLDDFVPQNHLLRPLRKIAIRAFKKIVAGGDRTVKTTKLDLR